MATSVPDGSRRNPANCNNKRVYWNGIPRRECYPWVYTGFKSFLHFQSCQKLSDVSNEEVIKFNFVQQRISPEGFRVVMLAVSIKDLLSLNVGK